MKFGYFTLSDNRYRRQPAQRPISSCRSHEQAVMADKLGMHSAWIGEHHFNRSG